MADKETGTNRHGCRGIPGPGRPRGSQNKVTRAAKEAFVMAFESLGGVESLTAWARRHPGDFYRLYARLIPTDTHVTGEARAPVTIVVRGVKPENKEGTG